MVDLATRQNIFAAKKTPPHSFANDTSQPSLHTALELWLMCHRPRGNQGDS
jgi:hypothetical protein